MAVELATAYVSITASAKGIAKSIQSEMGGPLEDAGDKAGTKSATRFGAAFKSGLGKAAKVGAVAFTAAFAGAAVIGKQAIDAASDLDESLAKIGVVFADSSKDVIAWSKNSATAFGQSQQSALEAAGTYGNLFQAFGIQAKPAQEMSQALVELAADLASFNNTSVEDALLALQSGVSGETEPLKRYGVAINDVRLREEALALGLIKTTKDALTPAAKAQASYSLIMKDTALAQGDFSRTSDGLANQQRILAAQWTNMKATIGRFLLPAITAVVSFLAGKLLPALPKIGKAFSLLLGDDGAYGFAEVLDNVFGNSGKLIPVFEKLGIGLRGVFFGLKAAGEAVVGFFVDNWETIKAVFEQIVAGAQAAFGAISDGVMWVINHQPVLIGVLVGLGAALTALFLSWAAGAASAAAATLAAAAPFIAIGVAIAAVTAAVIYAYQNWEWFRTAVDAVRAWMVDTLWPALQTVFGWLRDNVPPILQAIAGFFTGTVLPALQAVWAFVRDYLLPAFMAYAEFMIGAYKTAIEAAVTVVTTLWGWLQTLWDRSEGLRGFLAGAFKLAFDITTTSIGAVSTAVSTLWGWIKTLWDRAEPFRAFLAGSFWLAVTIVSTAFDAIATAVSTVWGWFQTIWDKAKEVAGYFEGAFNTAIGVVTAAWDAVSGAIEGVVGWLADVIEKAERAVEILKQVTSFGGLRGGVGVPDDWVPQGTGARANGGPVSAGMPYVVGERGWELFTPKVDGFIVPHEESVAMTSAAGSGLTIQGDVNLYDATDVDGWARSVNFQMAVPG